MNLLKAMRTHQAAALLVLGIVFSCGAVAGGPAQPVQYTACASATCTARWSALESALAASFDAAERDGAAGITQAGGTRRYALSQEGPQFEQWAATGTSARALVFARRDAAGALHIDSVVFPGAASGTWRTASTPRLALVLTAGAAAPEQRLWELLSALPGDPTMIKKRQSWTRLVAAVRDSRQILALVNGAGAGGLQRLAYVPDAIHINLQGAALANGGEADSSAYANSAPPVGSVNQYGTVVSSQLGAVVTLVKSADGKSSRLRFDIDPKKADTAAPADPGAADTIDIPPPADQ